MTKSNICPKCGLTKVVKLDPLSRSGSRVDKIGMSFFIEAKVRDNVCPNCVKNDLKNLRKKLS